MRLARNFESLVGHAINILMADVGELPFEGARCQNIENNPMQSSRRPTAFDNAI